MKWHTILIITLLILSFSCSNEEKGTKNSERESEFYQYNIDFSQKQIPLIDYMDDVHFTFLEETDSSLFSGVRKLIVTEESIFVVEGKFRKLLKFRADGSFVKSIYDRGGGPEQYSGINDLRIKGDTLIGVDSRRQRVLKLDSDLNFINAKKFEFRIRNFIPIQDQYVFSNNYLDLESENWQKKNLLFTDEQFNVVKASVPFEHLSYYAISDLNIFNQIDKDIYYKPALTDTVYKLDGVSKEVSAVYRFDLGGLWLYGTEIRTDQDYQKRYDNSFFQDQEILRALDWLEDKEVIIGKAYTVPDYRSLGFFIDKESDVEQIHYVNWMLGTDIRDAFRPLVLKNGRVYGSLDRDEFEYLLDQIPADDRSMLRNPNFEIVEGENPVLVSFKVKLPN